MLQFFLGQQVEAVPITHLTPLEVGPDAIAAQDATRKSYTTSVTVPAGRIAVGVVTPLSTEGQQVTIALGGDSQTTNTPNNITGNLKRPDGTATTYHEPGVVFEVAEPGTLALEITVPGGSTATLFGVVVRAPDPVSGVVSEAGTGENCGPKTIVHNGVRYSVHAELYTRNIFVSAEPGPKGVLAFPVPASGWTSNDRYHTGCAIIALNSGNLWLQAAGHNAPQMRCRLAPGGDLTSLTPIRTFGAASSSYSYIQLAQLQGSNDLFCCSRGHNGDTSGSRRAIMLRFADPDSAATGTPTFTTDYLTADGEEWPYSRGLSHFVHPTDGRELLAWYLQLRTTIAGVGTAYPWTRVGVALFDPIANGGLGHWWALDGTPAANNTGRGTAASPRFDVTQTSNRTGSGGILVADGTATLPAYFGYGNLTRITQWPTAGGAAKGYALFPAATPIDAYNSDSNDYTPRRSFARFVSTESRRLEATDTAAGNFEWNQPFSLTGIFRSPPHPTGGALVLAGKRLASGTSRGWALFSNPDGSNHLLTLQLRNSGSPDRRLQVRMAPGSGLVPDRWHHFAITYDGSGTPSGVKMWVNAVALPTDTQHDTLAGNTILNAVPFSVGSWEGGGNPFNGRLQNFRVHTRVLTDDEVLADYHGGVPLPANDLPAALLTGLHGAWDLDEQSDGSTAASRADSGPNAYTLASTGGNVRGETSGGVDLRVYIQNEATRTVSPDDFSVPAELQDWSSYRFASAMRWLSSTSAELYLTDRGNRGGSDALGEPRGLYVDWGGQTLRGYTLDLTNLGAPTFTAGDVIDHTSDPGTVIQMEAVEGTNLYVYPRTVSTFAQHQAAELPTVLEGAEPEPDAVQITFDSAATADASIVLQTVPQLAFDATATADATITLQTVPQLAFEAVATSDASIVLQPVPQITFDATATSEASITFDGSPVQITFNAAGVSDASVTLHPVPQISFDSAATSEASIAFSGTVVQFGFEATAESDATITVQPVPQFGFEASGASDASITFGPSVVQIAFESSATSDATITLQSVAQLAFDAAGVSGASILFGVGPQIISASASSSGITVVFDRDVEITGDALDGWSARDENGTPFPLTLAILADSRTLNLMTSSTILANQTVLFSYNPE